MALVPYVVEQTSRGERSYDIFSSVEEIDEIPIVSVDSKKNKKE